MKLHATNSEPLSKRSRPLLGTFFSISFEESNSHLINHAFEEADRLEKIFSLFYKGSELSRFNSDPSLLISCELAQTIKLAQQVRIESEGAFFPFIDLQKKSFDLNGIAKGFIVDRVTDLLLERNPRFRGIVNAGGDLRFANISERLSQLRCGPLERPVLLSLKLEHDAFASSSVSVSLRDSRSSSRYPLALRADLNPNFTVAVAASQCGVADALTKVALFAPDEEVIRHCAQVFKASILIVDDRGKAIRLIKET